MNHEGNQHTKQLGLFDIREEPTKLPADLEQRLIEALADLLIARARQKGEAHHHEFQDHK